MSDNTTYLMLNDPEMAEIVSSFIVETKELLEKLDFDLVDLEKSPNDAELLNQIFRAFHTIKGTSGFLGLDRLTRVTHKCEDLLNKLRKGEVILNTAIMDGILMAYDNIKDLLVAIETEKNENVPIDNTVEVLNKILSALESGAEVVVETAAAPEETTEAAEEPVEKKKKAAPKKKKGAKAKTEEPEETVESVPIPEAPKMEAQPVKANHEPEKEVKYEQSKEHAAAKTVDNSIRVDVERLDDLLNIVSELVLGRNRLAQVNSEVGLEFEGSKIARDLSDAAKQIDLMTNELQLVVMKTRMVKIGKVFNRFPRLVRDLARETGKQLNLVIKGEETELDKTLIEEINDPLVHLVRNSADHGVELPEDRKKAGKDPVGTIILSAEHEGNNIIITIEDDGKGINPDVLKEKAVSKGLISPEKAKELSKQDAYNLIFLPGFSTAEKVTKVSGRGVGMDVVKTNVTKLRGMINIESSVGQGTKIIIKLPLTLAIIPGLIIKIRDEMAVIPLNSVIEVVRVHEENIYTVNKNEVIKMRDGILPLVNIDKIMVGDEVKAVTNVWQYVVVVGIAEKKYGIKVDELIGQKEIVIKPLGKYLGNIEGIAGSTIMGDGTVVMILDIAELINKVAR